MLGDGANLTWLHKEPETAIGKARARDESWIEQKLCRSMNCSGGGGVIRRPDPKGIPEFRSPGVPVCSRTDYEAYCRLHSLLRPVKMGLINQKTS